MKLFFLSFKVLLNNFGLKRQVLILVMVILINRWSFGILLWETFTLGGTPYPGLPTDQLLDYLSDGKRMDMPAKCPLEVYTVMRDCWIHEPEQRPHFTTLTERLAKILEKHTTAVCINIPMDLPCSRGGGGEGGYSAKFYTMRLRVEASPVPFIYLHHFWQKRNPVRILSIDRWYTFYIPSVQLCIPFNCCKFSLF